MYVFKMLFNPKLLKRRATFEAPIIVTIYRPLLDTIPLY